MHNEKHGGSATIPQVKRKLKNFLLTPRFQLKYAAVIVALTVTAMCSCSVFLVLLFQSVLRIQIDRYSIKHWVFAFVVLFIANVVANFIIAILLTHRIVGPLYACERFVRKLQEGNYKERISPRRLDEVGSLMAQLNELASTLESSPHVSPTKVDAPNSPKWPGCDEKGNATLVIMLALALIGLSLSFIYNVQSNLWQNNSIHDSSIASLRAFESGLLAIVNDPDAWSNTFQNNATLRSCMLDNTFNCPAGNYSLDLRDADNSLFYQSGQPLNRYGSSCGALAQPDCLFAYTITWTPQCPVAGVCNQPPITIKFSLTSIMTPAIDTDNFISQTYLP